MIHHSKDLHYDPYRRICQYRLKHKIATIHRFFPNLFNTHSEVSEIVCQ